MSSPVIPQGWSTDDSLLEDYAETAFPGFLCGLPGPYKAIMFQEPDLEQYLLVQCGGTEAERPDGGSIYVFWDVISQAVTQIIEPTNLHDILTTMANTAPVANENAFETRELIMDESNAIEPYLPVPSGWLAEDESSDELLKDFKGDLYNFVPPHRPILRTITEDLFVIVTDQSSDVKLTYDEGDERRMPPTKYVVLWDKTSQVVKPFRRPLDEYEIAHFMCKEQRLHGRISWSEEYFSFWGLDEI